MRLQCAVTSLQPVETLQHLRSRRFTHELLLRGSDLVHVELKFPEYTGADAQSLCSGDGNGNVLQGHSSYITHLDWSPDNNFIMSNSGDYEILYCEYSDTTATVVMQCCSTVYYSIV